MLGLLSFVKPSKITETMSSEDFGIDMESIQFDHKTYDEKMAEKFMQLYSLDLNDKVENKNGLTYLSWPWAVAELRKAFPSATFKVVKNPQTNLPYFVDPAMGIMVYTEININGQTFEQWLPVLDSSNRAMKVEAYTYQVWNKTSRQYENRKVEAATMFDINKTIWRCLVKGISVATGIGLPLFTGEDMPESLEDNTTTDTAQPQSKPATRKRKSGGDRYDTIRQAINAAQSTNDLMVLYQQHPEVTNNPQIMALFTQRKEQLLNVA